MRRVLQKHSITMEQLGKKCNRGRHTVARWCATGKIKKEHYDKLLEMDSAETPVEKINIPLAGIPFSVTIPRSSLRFTLDKNGDINVQGLILPKLEREE